MTPTIAELNQVRIAILHRQGAEPPTRRRAMHWDKAAVDEGLTRHALVDGVDRERPNRIDQGAQK